MIQNTTRKTRTVNFSLSDSIFLALAFSMLVLVAIGCGRKNSPKPPEDFAPDPVLNFNIVGNVNGVLLSWEAAAVDPDKDDEDVKELGGFSIQKSPYSKNDDTDFDEIGVVTPDQGVAVAATPTPAAAATAAPVGAPVADNTVSYSFLDKDVKPGMIYNYQVLPKNTDGVKGEAGQTLRATFLGENSRIERITLESKRVKRISKKDAYLQDN